MYSFKCPASINAAPSILLVACLALPGCAIGNKMTCRPAYKTTMGQELLHPGRAADSGLIDAVEFKQQRARMPDRDQIDKRVSAVPC